MGSLGQYEGEVSNVHDVHIENVWMMNGDVGAPFDLSLSAIPNTLQYSGARIKVWAGNSTGTGFVNNVTFK
jgi:galacturan 1,4-alpha-galacturonidase